MLHVLPHWIWPGQEGKTIRVWCYSNCEEAELFLNNRSLGKKYMFAEGAMHIEWEINYEPGTVRVVALRGGKEVATKERATMHLEAPLMKLKA